ncbi:hypothetical protein [Wolbachia endosymbiont of Bemisia tabaci]|uniref:hypothetical protein n=1 Tax=Wolbachia endosymbiont of Bemisia tabaci TaxID=215173 RepID=UPI0015CFD103|nr:hypothetical protein [Wolbachia endosymbiont of Bemisia tabaci]
MGQLAAYQEVKVGRQYEAKSLYEALSHLKKEDSDNKYGKYNDITTNFSGSRSIKGGISCLQM